MFCPRCGQTNQPVARFCQSCGYDFSGTQPVVVSETKGETKYAGFWKRVAATLIDSCVVSLLTVMITAGSMGVAWFALFFLPWLYEAVMLSSEKQATLGKMALAIIVTDTGGQRITFGRATGRHFAKWISALSLGIGFVMAAFTE